MCVTRGAEVHSGFEFVEGLASNPREEYECMVFAVSPDAWTAREASLLTCVHINVCPRQACVIYLGLLYTLERTFL